MATKTTFWKDFSIAETFGKDAIIRTCNNAFENYKSDVYMLTELSVTLNHKLWSHFENNSPYARLYERLWYKVDEWCIDNLQGEWKKIYLKNRD